MKNYPKVAVVILCWNGKTFLEAFLPPLLKTTYPNVDYYVADNASTDDSVAFVKANYPSVKLIENGTNSGFATGYNLALKQVSADYYVLLNQDVEVSPGWIEPVIELMENDKTIAICQPKLKAQLEKNKFEYAGAAGGHIDRFGYAFTKGRIFNEVEADKGQYDNIADIVWATGACLFIKADLYHKFGGLDDDFFAHMEEVDLCWRIKNAGYAIKLCPQSITYHVGGGSLEYGSPMKTYLNYRNNLSMLVKNLSTSSLFFILPLRFLLDIVSAYKLLLEGEPKHFWAVFKAHFYFITRFFYLLNKRWKVNKVVNTNRIAPRNKSGFYKGLIIVDFFLKAKHKFSDLSQKSFY